VAAKPANLRNPVWVYLAPVAAAGLVAAILADALAGSPLLTLLATVLLAAAVFAAVHHAEVVALAVGEPFGSIVLAASVTVIEVSLIVTLMLASPDGATEIARDTVFAAVMIVLNGVVGLCLLVGGIRHHEQGFQIHGATGALSVLGTLATLTLILPNFTLAVPGPVYSQTQLIFVAVVSLALYGLFLFVQSVRHRDYFLDTPGESGDEAHVRPSVGTSLASLAMLVVALFAVVLLAETLSPVVERAVDAAGLPSAFVGVVIAAVVLLPESLSALRAARRNRLQTSLNLALGSALASIGLTIPAVAIVSLAIGAPLSLGLASEHVVLLVLAFFTSTLTLATGRTTVLQGGVHLVIFAAFLTIAAFP